RCAVSDGRSRCGNWPTWSKRRFLTARSAAAALAGTRLPGLVARTERRPTWWPQRRCAVMPTVLEHALHGRLPRLTTQAMAMLYGVTALGAVYRHGISASPPWA